MRLKIKGVYRLIITILTCKMKFITFCFCFILGLSFSSAKLLNSVLYSNHGFDQICNNKTTTFKKTLLRIEFLSDVTCMSRMIKTVSPKDFGLLKSCWKE